MTRRRHAVDAGWTLTELMASVAILGVLAALSFRAFKGNPAANAARMVSVAIQDARRIARSMGPVRADVAAGTGNTARTYLEFTRSGTDGRPGPSKITVWQFEEDALPAATGQWVLVGTQQFAESYIYAVGATAQTLPDQTLPSQLGGTAVQRYFYPDGTCQAMTVYVDKMDASGNTGYRYRVTALPLSSIPSVFKSW